MPVVIIIAVVLIAILCMSIKIVPQANVYVIERLGKYRKNCQAGINIIIPVIDRVAKRVNMKEQVLDFPPQPVITKDNVAVHIDSVVFFRVTDPKLFTYGFDNPINGIGNLSATTLRNIVGGMEFDDVLTSRDNINATMTGSLDTATDPWGIKIIRVEVKNIQPPHDILDVMQKQMTAEREKRQAILEAEGYKQASVTHAEGDKQAKILAAEAERDAQIALAEGQAKSIELVYKAEAEGLRKLIEAGITPEVLKLKSIEAMKDIADGNATKVFFPTDITSIGGLGITGEALDLNATAPAEKITDKAPETGKHVRHNNRIGNSHITEKVINTGHKTQARLNVNAENGLMNRQMAEYDMNNQE